MVEKIRDLGLRMAPQETEAIWINGLLKLSSRLRVGDAEIQVGQYMKYLVVICLTLENR